MSGSFYGKNEYESVAPLFFGQLGGELKNFGYALKHLKPISRRIPKDLMAQAAGNLERMLGEAQFPAPTRTDGKVAVFEKRSRLHFATVEAYLGVAPIDENNWIKYVGVRYDEEVGVPRFRVPVGFFVAPNPLFMQDYVVHATKHPIQEGAKKDAYSFKSPDEEAREHVKRVMRLLGQARFAIGAWYGGEQA
ncbi:hypothetical protein HYV85_05755 [Candidatus Woesearchaeota archaeon]|nr:hypothetical protein [Candidatus Woesearchaeota archaeon]